MSLRIAAAAMLVATTCLPALAEGSAASWIVGFGTTETVRDSQYRDIEAALRAGVPDLHVVERIEPKVGFVDGRFSRSLSVRVEMPGDQVEAFQARVRELFWEEAYYKNISMKPTAEDATREPQRYQVRFTRRAPVERAEVERLVRRLSDVSGAMEIVIEDGYRAYDAAGVSTVVALYAPIPEDRLDSVEALARELSTDGSFDVVEVGVSPSYLVPGFRGFRTPVQR